MITRGPVIRLMPILIALLFARLLGATSIVPRTWEELVLDADFIGIVECETAGGIVARYRVIETWKGTPATGDRMSIVKRDINEGASDFPIDLCGERLLVMADKERQSHRSTRLTDNPFPHWWRRLPSDYEISRFQGYIRLPLEKDDEPLFVFCSKRRTLVEFREDVDRILALSPADREMYMIKKLAGKALSDPNSSGVHPPVQTDNLLRSIAAAKTPADMVNQLLEFGRKHRETWGIRIVGILSSAGAEKTLEIVESLSEDRAPLNEKRWREFYRENVAGLIRRRLRISPPAGRETPVSIPDPPVPTAEELEQARTKLATGRIDWTLYRSFEMLTRHDPDTVAKHLVSWTFGEGAPGASVSPYVLGSWFGYRCGRDRDRNLRALLKAKDPYVCVAGAVYLCFEQKAEGMTALKKFATLKGDPGAWTAVVLASRGDKSSVPRALRVLADEGERNMAGSLHRSLQNRLKVLLSNTARASKLPQPAPPLHPEFVRIPDETNVILKDPTEEEVKAFYGHLYRYYADWWEANREKAVLTDPWLPLLDKQKVD